MKKSMRSRRMAKHYKRLNKVPKLNLVSLMDIFTILVFFLMVNSSDVQVLENNKSIKLPESIADQQPDDTLVISVSGDDVVVMGRKVASVAEVLVSEELLITELKDELAYQASRRPALSELELQQGRAVTIMGDHSIPYSLLKRIMASCAETDFRNISLAVRRQFPSEVAEPGSVGGGL